ncbi:hypothetical protein HPB50_000562 [Hyalomma asiaticum]|uniref:Uncharacterized protein n=1 Tax=Hyalomma asiaticum TaxID=266040 RepID=A0ACB7T2S0_HYAAI|nr:hypothetical protein HPB50_000562 [Hyalomma asiaticum]
MGDLGSLVFPPRQFSCGTGLKCRRIVFRACPKSGRVGPGLGYEMPGRAWAARPLYIIGLGWPASGKHRARAGPGRNFAARAHL